MKKVALIIFAVLFFAAILGLLLLKLFRDDGETPSVQTSTTTSAFTPALVSANLEAVASPETVVRQCYSWYVTYFANTRQWTYEQLASEPFIQRCFSASFLQSWEGIIGVSEIDPVLLTADYYESWLDAIAVRTTSQISQSADVEIVLGSGDDTYRLSAQLERSGAAWQIKTVRGLQNVE